MDTILKGYEMQLLVLQDMSDTAAFTEESLEACANCFQPVELCTCHQAPLRWPIKDVIRKLNNKLSRYRS